MVKFVLTILIFSFTNIAFCQETKLPEIIINIAEELAADDSDPEAAASYTERLYELAENPVKLNSPVENEISRLFFLSDFQVKALIDYVHSSGRIISVYELVNIPGFDKETARMMIPFITLESRMTMNGDSIRWRNSSITNISVRTGNNDSTLPGSLWKVLSKYKFASVSFSGGLTIEKDPGETFLNGNPPVPDFLSAHIAYNGNGLIRRLIAGDYSARFGQGTNINTGIGTALSLTAPGYMSARDEIKPYTSTDENNFFRGIAAEFSLKNFGLHLFYSKNLSDATTGSSPDSSEAYIENFYLTGIHSNPSQTRKKDAVTGIVYGLNLSYDFKNIRIGLTWSEETFSLPVKPPGNDPAEIFEFKGRSNNLYSLSYNSLIKRLLLYGELSMNANNKYAFVQGISIRPSDRLTINFLARKYIPGYISFHGKGPGSGSPTGNGTALLGNFTFEAARHLFISGGCYLQNFPWLKYRCSAPSAAMREELCVRFLPVENLIIDASYSYRYTMADKSETYGIPEQQKVVTRSVKGSVRFSLSENLTTGMRIDYKILNPNGYTGSLLLQDINYKFRRIPVTVWLRYCIFKTDSWDSRLYTYENDLLYSFSIPALSGAGSRSYLMIKWEICNNAELRIKYGLTTTLKSGTNGKDIEELKIQYKMLF